VNSKVVLVFAVVALVAIAFYVVRAKERAKHGRGSIAMQAAEDAKDVTNAKPKSPASAASIHDRP
jgi:hypothetical protein